jgi:hypothetical protein
MPSALVRHISLPAIAATGLLLALQISGLRFSHAAIKNANDFLVVDCLLPGQVRKLISRMTYVTARRPIRTSAVDCGSVQLPLQFFFAPGHCRRLGQLTVMSKVRATDIGIIGAGHHPLTNTSAKH